MARDENDWARWNFKQKYGYFPKTKKNANISVQFSQASIDKHLEGKVIPQDEWGGDRPVSVIHRATGERRTLAPQLECPECYVRKHTTSGMDNHIMENHPDVTDLPGKKDGMIF